MSEATPPSPHRCCMNAVSSSVSFLFLVVLFVFYPLLLHLPLLLSLFCPSFSLLQLLAQVDSLTLFLLSSSSLSPLVSWCWLLVLVPWYFAIVLLFFLFVCCGWVCLPRGAFLTFFMKRWLRFGFSCVAG